MCDAVLQGANLNGASLEGASLSSSLRNIERALGQGALRLNTDATSRVGITNLSGASLELTNLVDARLRAVLLMNADLNGANMMYADLSGAMLQNADLENAFLVESRIAGATLSGANLRGVHLGGTVLGNLDLTDVRSLDTVKHLGPSWIDPEILYCSSRSPIPASFLRGVGLPEDLIDRYSGTPDAVSFCSCFISYSHADKGLARRLHNQLQAHGIRCWLDQHNLKPGDRILDVVNDAIRLHDKILFCCSEASLNSWWVKDEIRKAQERERRDGRDIIIPLMVDRYLLDGWEDGLAADLRSRLAADFTGWEHDNAKFEEQFERVVKALRTDEGARRRKHEGRCH